MTQSANQTSRENSESIVVGIVGAGIVGVTSALALVERGFDVLLLDKQPDAAQATSKSNGAQLSYAYADAMAAPGLLAMAGRILVGQEPGMKFRLKPNVHNLFWLISFLREGSKKQFLANTAKSLDLALRSKAQMDLWREQYGFSFDHKVTGKLQLLPDQNAVDGLADLVELKKKMGMDQSILSPSEAVEIEPALRSFCGDLAGVLYSPNEEVGDPEKFAKEALARILAASRNNKFLHSHSVSSLVVRDGAITALKTDQGDVEADAFVFATGHWSPELSGELGVSLPVVPVAGYSLTFPSGPNAPTHSITDVKGKSVLCPLGDKIRIAGLADIGETATVADPKRIDQLRDVMSKRFPVAAKLDEEGEPWIGHRPVTPNSQPIVRPTKLSNGFVNCGHGTLGWTTSAGTAVELAELICAKFGVSQSAQRITSSMKVARNINPSGDGQAISA